MSSPRERDRLYLLKPGFENPAYPGQSFYCWHCALFEGVLASFPQHAGKLDVTRVPWPRPRHSVIEVAGEANQSLPLLVLADDAPGTLATGSHGGRRFVAGRDAILKALSIRHGFPDPHP